MLFNNGKDRRLHNEKERNEKKDNRYEKASKVTKKIHENPFEKGPKETGKIYGHILEMDLSDKYLKERRDREKKERQS
jgi:hypothetical protein